MTEMKKLDLELSIHSMQEAINYIEQYKRYMILKTARFVEELASVGIPVIDANMNTEGDSDPEHYAFVKVHSYGDYSEAILTVQGRDLLFIEFGAGVHYNGAAGSSDHPKGTEWGYTIGSYGHGHGAEDFWWYQDDSGDSKKSYGTKASMPVLQADKEIMSKVREVARKVFGG